MRALALVVGLAACGDEARVIQPVFDGPFEDPDATASGVDGLAMAVARAGSDQDIASQSFLPGEVIELGELPFDVELVVHLTGRVGTSDIAYGRTCSFAVLRDRPPPAPHLFFARNVKFATMPFETATRDRGVAVTLDDGSALLLGGSTPASAARVERFDPRVGELAHLTELEPRGGAVATTLGSGATERVAVVGGTGAGLAELLDLTSSSTVAVERREDERLARAGLSATALTDGRAVVVGGRLASGVPASDVVELSITGGAFEIRSLPARLARPRSEHTATRLGDDVGAPVLIVGGVDDAGAPVAVAELFKPLSRDFANPATFAPAMVVPRRGHRAALLPDGSVLLVGGLDATGAPVRLLERFSIDAGFVVAGELPANAGVIDHTATPLPDGRILIAGGRTVASGVPGTAAFIARLDVLDGVMDVVATDPLAIPRAGHQAALLCDGTLLVNGGTPEPSRSERYNPPPAGRR